MNTETLQEFVIRWMWVQQTFRGNSSYCKLAVALNEEFPGHTWRFLISLSREVIQWYGAITDLEFSVYREVAEGSANVL